MVPGNPNFEVNDSGTFSQLEIAQVTIEQQQKEIERLSRVRDEQNAALTSLHKRIAELEAGIRRLATPEAFHLSRAMTNHPADIELKERMQFAEELLK